MMTFTKQFIRDTSLEASSLNLMESFIKVTECNYSIRVVQHSISELDIERVVRVILVGLCQERQDDSPAVAFLLLVELVDGGDVVVGELKVEDGGVLLDPLRPGRLGHHGHAPLDVPSEDDLLEARIV